MVCESFEGSSFLFSIKDEPNGLARNQEQLLSDILSWKNIKIDNTDRGINLIKERLRCRRVLLVLDDLDDSVQWRELVGDRNWFCPGSRIIVTTRDEHLLTELEVDRRYKVKGLNKEESIQLLSWYAFKRPVPDEDYLQLSNSLVEHAQGHPLALVILGSYLFKRSQPQWESFVEKLRKVPHHQIHKRLRISNYDALGDDFLKAMFLDIACLYIGMDKNYVMPILDGCGFFPKDGIQVLLERSLIEIDGHKLKMHDLLRDMGREIVREESPSHPGYRSRLWFHQDVVDVLTNHTGTEAVVGLILDVPALKDVIVSIEAFAKMIKLRLLKIDSVHFTGSYEKISKELRWLCWLRCPLVVLPPNLHLDNLVVLESLQKLKILDLRYSVYLEETPNFARLSSLERVELGGCRSLVEVDQSIGHLERLQFLNLEDCDNIRELPDSICRLRSLETLNLQGCSKLCSLPEHFGKLEALRELYASRSAITELPNSIGLLKNLGFLHLAELGEELPSTSCFSFFSTWMSPKSSACPSSLLLPESFHHLSSLRDLDLNLSVSALLITVEDLLTFKRDFRSYGGLSWSADPNVAKKYWRSWKPKHFEAYFPAREVPDWFEYKQVGSSVWFCMPSTPVGKIRAMILCAICSANEECKDESTCYAASLTIHFKNKTKGCETVDRAGHRFFDEKICKDHAWVSYITPHIFIWFISDEGHEIEVSFEPPGGILVKECGICLPILERRHWDWDL
ncbi:hypothetical protein PTKIN_Ptkin09bG0239900 [Pterospermum kingtungense]